MGPQVGPMLAPWTLLSGVLCCGLKSITPLGYHRLWLNAPVSTVSLRWIRLFDSIICIIATPKQMTTPIGCISYIPKKLQCPRWHPGAAFHRQPTPPITQNAPTRISGVENASHKDLKKGVKSCMTLALCLDGFSINTNYTRHSLFIGTLMRHYLYSVLC